MAGAAGAAAVADTGAASGGANQFWQVTNLYSRKNKAGQVASTQLGGGQLDGGGPLDAVGFLRGPRIEVRTATNGVGTPTADNPGNVMKYVGLLDTDGTPIINPQIDGYAWIQMQRHFRPWLKDPMLAWDYAQSASPSVTFFLMPEVRQQLAVLENTDTRQQYSWTHSLNTAAAVASGTAPFLTVTVYVDVWAQPDVTDLEGVDNERVPPGVNLQTKVRQQPFTLNNAGADNIFLSSLTGNALRGGLLIVRDSNNVRQDYLSNPINWMLDDRTLSVVDIDMYFQWAEDFYASFGQARAPRPTGIYAFPRFYNIGALLGQGWLYTSSATAVSWETSTLATAVNLPGTAKLIQEEVYNVGPIDTSLLDL